MWVLDKLEDFAEVALISKEYNRRSDTLTNLLKSVTVLIILDFRNVEKFKK